MSVSFAAMAGLSLVTCRRLLRTLALASSVLTSLMSRELIATSCIRLSFCALTCSSSASLRSVSADVPQAAMTKTSGASVNMSFFIGTTPLSRVVRLVLPRVFAALRRYVRLQLPGMEGKFLSAQTPDREVARVLCPTIRRGRDQLHVLPHAQRQDGRRLECRDPGGIHLRVEGAATHHALCAPAKHRRIAPLLMLYSSQIEHQTWGGAISITPQF